MNAMPNLDEICQRVVDCYKKTYGDDIQSIYLYGSYARGDFDEESDIDFTAIVRGEQAELRKKRYEVSNDISDICLDYDVVVSFGVIPAFYFDKYSSEVPYYQNLLKEGKKLA